MTVDQSILKREIGSDFTDAISGLSAELDELRAMLETAAVEFDALLDESVSAIPTWVEIDREELRGLFALAIGDEQVSIGPRAAALIAARLQAFLERPPTHSMDDAAREAWAAEVDELAALMESLADGGRATAQEANERLRGELEGLVAQIAEERESGAAADQALDALRRKLLKDKPGAAQRTREHEADALEEQRRKTEEIERAWAPFEQLTSVAADVGVDASERLGAMLKEFAQAVVAGRPELEIVAPDWVDPAPEVVATGGPPPLPGPDAAGPDSEVEVVGSPADPEPESHDSVPGPRVRVDTNPPRAAQDTPLAPAGATATMDVIATTLQFREPTFRVVSSWETVEKSEVAIAIGPPALYLLGITSVTLAYQVGLWPENPFEAWPGALWMFPAFALWAVGMPGLQGWRVEWDGPWPRPIRLNTRREGGFAEIDEVGVELENYSFQFATSTADLQRWRDSTSRGWTLVLENDDQREVRLASVAESQRWDDSISPCAEVEPEGAWRVSEEALLHLADECG